MKKILTAAIVLFGIVAFSLPAHALFFTFTGTDQGGVGSGTMNVTTSGSQLTIVVQNTSPVYTSLNNFNAPAITGFGFNVGGLDSGDVLSWTLKAYSDKANTSLITIGGTVSTDEWNFGNIPGETFNIELVNVLGVQDGLYNPSVLGGQAAQPYYTTATLVMNFNANITSFTDPLFRMQNVGEGGQGSLKIPGEGSGIPVPEPATMILLGLGLLGVGIAVRKRS